MPIKRAPPILSDNAPAIGATNIGMIVHGRIRNADPSGRVALHGLEELASRKIEPNIPKNISRDATFASAKTRFWKKRIGSIGSFVWSSQRTKSANTTAPPARAMMISGDAQPCRCRA